MTSFEQRYRCYPPSFINKQHLETGDKIIMPPSALDRLASLQIDYPMMFQIHNDVEEQVSHCGVLEFTAEEGFVYMPYWKMQDLLLQEGDLVRLNNATLPKGTFVKLQPHTSDFLDVSNPRAVLERTLRNFSCLTTGDSVMVEYNNKKYYIDIVETKPASAVSIIETDCEVDFAPPLDYNEPERPVNQPAVPVDKTLASKLNEAPEGTEPKFSPFTGAARRLDGKTMKLTPEAAGISKDRSTEAAAKGGKQLKTAPTSQGGSSGKLVFGSTSQKNGQKAQAKDAKKQYTKKEEPKFQAFSGKKYTLQ